MSTPAPACATCRARPPSPPASRWPQRSTRASPRSTAQPLGLRLATPASRCVLGPTLDLARDPRAGRIPEGLGEDPYLSGLLGAAHVRGSRPARHRATQALHRLQRRGPSHRLRPRTRPGRRDGRPGLDRVLQDAYLRPFHAAIEAGAWSMMGSYNQMNGEYASESATCSPSRATGVGWVLLPRLPLRSRDDAKALAAGMDLGALGGPGRRTRDGRSRTCGVVEALVTNLIRALIGSGLVDHPSPCRAVDAVHTRAPGGRRAGRRGMRGAAAKPEPGASLRARRDVAGRDRPHRH